MAFPFNSLFASKKQFITTKVVFNLITYDIAAYGKPNPLNRITVG